MLDVCLGGKYVDKMFSMRNQEIYTGLTVVNLHVPMVPMCLFTSPTTPPNTGCCFKVCPSLSYTFLPPFFSPSLQNKINWIFITELKALSLLYWWEQYCSIWLNKLLQPLWFSGHFWCKKYFFIYAYLFPWLSFPTFFCFVPIEFFLNRKLGNWRSLYLLCVKQCCKA